MQPASSAADMRRLICGFSVSIAIAAVAELKIADRLADGPKTTRDLARATGANEDFLRRTLRYLASEGVFRSLADDRFALTDLSDWLRVDAPGSLHPRALFTGSQVNWLTWSRLPEALMSGRSAAEETFGMRIFDYIKTNSEAAAAFNSFMVEQTRSTMDALLSTYRFDRVRELVDVGGGRGALLAAVLQAYPHARGILFDMPEVVATAEPVLAGVTERCRIVGGSFFNAVPRGADLYVLKFILHDWGDADCVRILGNCRQAMDAAGRVLIVENVLPDDDAPHFARFMDMLMLAMTHGGRERTRRQFEDLLAQSGLRLQSVAETPLGISALECAAA